tara:strand:- start:37 stop:219 length:183 start_codon:yes stop_codon:yes gene_type:complete
MYYSATNTKEISIDLSKRFEGYHVLCAQKNVEEIEFECYNLQEAELIDLDELRKILKKDE